MLTNRQVSALFGRLKKNEIYDNDKRGSLELFPCIYSPRRWTLDEVDRPDPTFNWRNFWRSCKRHFPLHSVAGGYTYNTPEIITRHEYNKVPMRLFLRYGKNNKNGRRSVLEIGYGFGGASERFNEFGYDYTGIDYVSSGKTGNFPGKFIEIEESGIPKYILDAGETFDLVYSDNVFQHMTKQQRLEYYKQAHQVLKKDGLLYITLFCKNRDRFRQLYTKKEEGELLYACNFFGVHTSVPNLSEVLKQLRSDGFKILDTDFETTSDDRTNNVSILARKK